MYTLEESYSLSAEATKRLLSKHVNPSLAKLFSFFSFSDDKPISSEGCYIYLEDGRKILDITGGIGVLNHGHNHPEILQARIDYQANRRMEIHKNYLSQLYVALAANISELSPGDLNKCFFPSSGSEAVEGCIKMAYKYANPIGHDRNILLHSSNSFHGKLFGAGAATGSPELNYKFPSPFVTCTFKRNDISSLQEAINSTKVDGKSKAFCLIYESFSASLCTGSSNEFMKALRELTLKEDIILICDEVYSGFYKTGPLFNFMKHDITPDLVSFGKSFGGGKSSISGYVARDPVFHQAYGDSKYATLHSTTYSGLGEEAATAIKSIEIANRDNYEKKSLHIENTLSDYLSDLAKKSSLINDVTGEGALWAIQINIPSFFNILGISPGVNRSYEKALIALLIEKLYTEHNILSFFGSNDSIKLIVSLPLIATDDDLDILMNAFDDTFINTSGLKRLAASKAISTISGLFN